MFGGNGDYPNLSPFRPKRIPKPPMCQPPGAKLTIRLVARIDVDKGDALSIHGNGELEREIVLLLPYGLKVDPARDQPAIQPDPFKKLDLLRLGGQPIQPRMFQNEIQREQPPHNDVEASRSPVEDVLGPQRPVDRLAGYQASLGSTVEG